MMILFDSCQSLFAKMMWKGPKQERRQTCTFFERAVGGEERRKKSRFWKAARWVWRLRWGSFIGRGRSFGVGCWHAWSREWAAEWKAESEQGWSTLSGGCATMTLHATWPRNPFLQNTSLRWPNFFFPFPAMSSFVVSSSSLRIKRLYLVLLYYS